MNVRTGRWRMALMAAVAALAMGCTAACSGSATGSGSSDGDTKPNAKERKRKQEQKQEEKQKQNRGQTDDNVRGPLTAAELDKAALATGDVAGYTVTTLPGSPPAGGKADKSACLPLTAVLNGKPEPLATATVYRRLAGGKDEQTVVTEFLGSHASNREAARVLGDLRAAVGACAGGFTAKGGEDGPSKYTGVKELDTARAGDDALAYQLTGDYEGEPVPLVFHVVRSGATVATFYTANLVDAKTPDIPAVLLTAQADKFG
ncbi:hypothetical protein [Streptomyces sp. NPDC051219]|uniref:hypothetical protein n=1 Tax=Streptomyces sp. NPDC051219 TaxID=3155283 RepID=UPI00343BA650